MPAGEAPLIYIVAGEPSGDALGGALMAALKERTGGRVRFAGIGGERMAEEGLRSAVPLHELAIMGVLEVLPRARRILRLVRETAVDIMERQPAAVVTIDSSGFTWRVAERLRKRGAGMKLIHYVAPMVWAWRPGRARLIARWYDHLMALLPFEPPYFEAVGLSCSYVGHPVVESGADRGDGAAFRARHGIPADAPILCVLPGSRYGEVTKLLPIFLATARRVAEREPGLRVVMPTVATVAGHVKEAAGASPVPAIVVEGKAEKYDAFAASRVALAASGTVALELAMAGVPSVISYKVNPVSILLLKRIIKVPYANLVNLLLDREAVPEMLQERCAPEMLSSALGPLMMDEGLRAAQRAAYDDALIRLGRGGPSPSLRAADQVLRVMASLGPA